MQHDQDVHLVVIRREANSPVANPQSKFSGGSLESAHIAVASLCESLDTGHDATLGDAIVASRLAERFPGVDLAAFSTGVWSRPRPPRTPLRDGDRVELYRPLEADAKAGRRARARLRTSSTRSRSGR